jgi:hypothetical protein
MNLGPTKPDAVEWMDLKRLQRYACISEGTPKMLVELVAFANYA